MVWAVQAMEDWRFAEVTRGTVPGHTDDAGSDRPSKTDDPPLSPTTPTTRGLDRARATARRKKHPQLPAGARALSNRLFPRAVNPVVTDVGSGEAIATDMSRFVGAPAGRRLLHVVAVERACMRMLAQRGLVQQFPTEEQVEGSLPLA